MAARLSSFLPGTSAVAVLVLLGGCAAAGGSSAAAPAPGGCTETAASPAELDLALAGARPGSTVCVRGDGLQRADLLVVRSGEPGRPVVLQADGAVVRSVTVDADHVVVQGFETVGGEGVVLRGAHLVARGNTVRDAVRDGVSCELECADVLVEDNTVVGADGSGIIVEGQRVVVRGNRVSGSVRRQAGDADGIRFFGTGVQLLDNTVTDISAEGYAGEPPHTDCFQTYDNSRLPTVDAVVTGNTCRDVDAQCLIATAEESGRDGAVGRSHGLLFAGNVCDVGGAQAVLVRWFPGVVVRDNVLGGPALDRAAIFLEGSTGAVFEGNTVPAGVVPLELDATSRAGSTVPAGD